MSVAYNHPACFTAFFLLGLASVYSFQIGARNVDQKNAGSSFTSKTAGLGGQESLILNSLQSGVAHKRSTRASDLGIGADDLELGLEDDGVLGGGLGGFLQIKEAPPKLLEAREHGKTVLECSAAGSPAPRVTWYKDGRPLVKDHSASLLRNSDSRDVGFEDSLGETISHLSLDCVSENDAGYYECVAQNSNGQKTTVGTEVNVVSFGASTGCSSKAGYSHSPPKIYQWIGTYMQTMGSPGKLLCNTLGKHQTTWISPNEKQIVSGQKYKILPNGDLYIHDLSFEDMGMFRCMVSNEFGHDMKETFVYPLAPMK